MPPDLALCLKLISSNYIENNIFMVPNLFEPLKFDCIQLNATVWKYQCKSSLQGYGPVIRLQVQSRFMAARKDVSEHLFENISIFHGCMVWIEKSVTRVTDRHHEACRTVIPSDRFFCPHHTPMIDTFSCIPFD